MLDYRRGIQDGSWQKLWHFMPACPSYPRKTFQIHLSEPGDEELCSRCWSLSREEKRMPQ